MTIIPNPSYKIVITQEADSNHYVLTEPHDEHTFLFMFEAARFIRDTGNSKTATVKLLNGETLNFGPCGTTFRSAFDQILEHFFKGNMDLFLSIVEKAEIDTDNHLQITINPDAVNRGSAPTYIPNRNVAAGQIEEIEHYARMLMARHYLSEFLDILGAEKKYIDMAANINLQNKVGQMPIRFVNREGQRLTVTRGKDGGYPDIRYG